jgi:hypothetical protein
VYGLRILVDSLSELYCRALVVEKAPFSFQRIKRCTTDEGATSKSGNEILRVSLLNIINCRLTTVIPRTYRNICFCGKQILEENYLLGYNAL